VGLYIGALNVCRVMQGRVLADARRRAEAQSSAAFRSSDIEASRALLLELALYEPNVTHCLNLLASACLTEDISIVVRGRSMTDAFRSHVNMNYRTFCTDAVKCSFIYGFVPWYPRKLPSGDLVPMTLPHGTFTWTVETQARAVADARGRKAVAQAAQPAADRDDADDKAKGKAPKGDSSSSNKTLGEQRRGRWDHLEVPPNENGSKLVQHRVRLTHADIDPEDVFVFDVATPDLNVNGNSLIYATVCSPLSHLLSDYKNLRDAQIRRSYADAWNTTARIFTSCVPPNAVSNEPTHSYLYYETGSERSRLNQGRYYMESRHRELEQQIAQPSNHVPSLYNLPVHHRIEQLSSLTPCEDVALLLDKYRRDTSSLLGIPYEIAYGHARGGQEGAGHSETNSRLFSNTVQRLCGMLSELVKSVYCTLYECEPGDVEVTFNPVPRLDVHSMDDLKILWEIGAVTPDVTAQLSEILLLGERTNLTGRKRKTTHDDGAYLQNLQNITKATAPPPREAPRGAKR